MSSAPHDIVLNIIGENAASERRITPSWTISQLRAKLETITGVPPSFQRLLLKLPQGAMSLPVPIEAADEDSTTLLQFPLQNYADLHVQDIRPASVRPNFTDDSNVEKYVMPEEEYSQRTDSVLAWKRRNQLGRFNPNQEDEHAAEAMNWVQQLDGEVRSRGIKIGARCRIMLPNEHPSHLSEGVDRRGLVSYIGAVPEVPGPAGGVWIGVYLDEPLGKNDGSLGGKKYFSAQPKHGSFVRPDRVIIGEFPVKSLEDEDDMEEL